jgi:hypothetical protein
MNTKKKRVKFKPLSEKTWSEMEMDLSYFDIREETPTEFHGYYLNNNYFSVLKSSIKE